MSQQYDPAQQLPPADWYPDPANEGQERYWDGTRWTTRMRPIATPGQPGQTGQVTTTPGFGQPGFAGVTATGQTGYGPQAGSYQPAQGHQQAYQPSYPPQQGYSQYQGAGYYGPTTADGVPLAGWWARVGAAILDSLILTIVAALVMLPFADTLITGFNAWFEDMVLAAQTGASAIPDYTDPQYGLAGPMRTISFINVAISIAYATGMLVWKGGTLGQLAIGLRVARTGQGQQHNGLSIGTALLRNVAYYGLGLISILFLINVLLPLANTKKQALHDMIARTQVVKIR
ncbi:RDD family protein [Propionimicrobium sp. PCR01-08-3]|uniref:RDD family protein n=1 Tax=Propionimicrobium sp. PCR01-08-3 TaxID=3052086 RepID=UPI00255CFD0C|nr:RDD family protein [Propionimicrobium sp. PCR01-08-3]WIY83330.1 RDD family protein [Propionimicrobium sp. PCR01-08-3]